MKENASKAAPLPETSTPGDSVASQSQREATLRSGRSQAAGPSSSSGINPDQKSFSQGDSVDLLLRMKRETLAQAAMDRP